MARNPDVLVVGSGIIGASIAWHLARAGAHVAVVDSREAGGLATRASFAWINASAGNPEPYARLRMASMAEWRRLEREVAGVEVDWSGGLFWQLPPGELDAFAREHAGWGYELRQVDRAEIGRLEPALLEPPGRALHAPGEGATDPIATARVLLDAAAALGAEMRFGETVQSLVLDSGRVAGADTSGGRIAAGEVVLAGGIATPSLAAMAGIDVPLVHAPGLLVASVPIPKMLNGVLVAPELELRQTPEGRLLAAADVKPGVADGGVAQLFEAAKRLVRCEAGLAMEFSRIGFRPMPRDGFPILGRGAGVEGLYVAVTHSGVTLAPAIGRFAAEEILDGRRDELIGPYGVDRFRVALSIG